MNESSQYNPQRDPKHCSLNLSKYVSELLIKLLIKGALLIINFQNSTVGGPMTKKFALQSCFLYII